MNWNTANEAIKEQWGNAVIMIGALLLAGLFVNLREKHQQRDRRYFVSYWYFMDDGQAGTGCAGLVLKFDVESWPEIEKLTAQVKEMVESSIAPKKQTRNPVIISWRKLK